MGGKRQGGYNGKYPVKNNHRKLFLRQVSLLNIGCAEAEILHLDQNFAAFGSRLPLVQLRGAVKPTYFDTGKKAHNKPDTASKYIPRSTADAKNRDPHDLRRYDYGRMCE
jgi:hypothetical protein